MINKRHTSKNAILLFTASRYIGYGLQFLYGVLIARFLGPYLLGIWGFLMLVQRYLSYTSLGLQFAVTLELSTETVDNPKDQERVVGVALGVTSAIAVCLSLLGLVIQGFGLRLFEKYAFTEYALLLGVLVGLTHLKQVLTNVYRVYGNLARIAFVELFSVALPLSATFLFRGEALIFGVLGAMILAGIVSAVVYLVRAPFKISFAFDYRSVRQMLAIGLPLLVKNVSFYLIMISARTVLSVFYPVETMGQYSLANSISNVTLLGLNAVVWVIFPDLLSRSHAGVADAMVTKTVQKVNDLYSTAAFLAVFAMILALPLLFFFLPDYQPAEKTIGILLLSQAIFSVCFGFDTVATARKRQLQMAKNSIIAVVTVIGFSLTVASLGLDFVWIAVSVLLGSFVYTLLQTRLGFSLLNAGRLQPGYWASVLPLGSIASVLCFFVGSLSGYTTLGGLIGLAVFVITSREKLGLLWSFGVQKTMKAA